MNVSPDRSTGRSSRLKSGTSAGSNPAPGTAAEQEVAHGWTVDDIDRIAAGACAADRSRIFDYRTRYGLAWSAIAFALHRAGERPTHQQLHHIGWRAIYDEVDALHIAHGYRHKDGTNGPGSAPRFTQYWTVLPQTLDDDVIERVAVKQLLPLLTPAQREAIQALADHGTYQAAASALGLDYNAFKRRIGQARHRVRPAWFAPETPPPIKGHDRRALGRELANACGNGHPWTDENTRWHRRGIGRRRVCATCQPERHQAGQPHDPDARDGRLRADAKVGVRPVRRVDPAAAHVGSPVPAPA